MRRLLLGLEQAQRRFAIWAELDTQRPLQDDSYAERLECFEEERFARCIVADSEYDVVKHEFLLKWPLGVRSEEHTSELQSLMRISYAVFCLKKKNTTLQIK